MPVVFVTLFDVHFLYKRTTTILINILYFFQILSRILILVFCVASLFYINQNPSALIRLSISLDKDAIYNMFDSHAVLIKPARQCPTAHSEFIIFFFGICSSIHNRYERELIRETWGTDVAHYNLTSKYKIVYLFFVGTTSEMTVQDKVLFDEEVAVYGDIVQMDFVDNYRNLTLKTYSILKYSVEMCPQAHYTFKTDDDCYVNIRKFILRFGKINSSQKLMIGQMNKNSKVQRNSTHRWYVSKQQYRESTYPAYLNGGGYLMTRSAAFESFRVCQDSKFIPIEDIWLTGICAAKAEVKVYHDADFNSYKITNDVCYFESMILIHPMNLRNFLNIWKVLRIIRENTTLQCMPKYVINYLRHLKSTIK